MLTLKNILLISSLAVLASCAVTYGDNMMSNTARLTQDSCKNKTKNVLLFFEGERVDFEYEKISFIEAVGDEYASNEKVLNHLKYEAWKNCANAVINVKSSYKERETGTLFTTKNDRKYSAIVFTGLAIRIKTDSLKMETDTLFISKVNEDYNQEIKKTSNQVTASFIGILATIVLLIVVLVNSNS